MKRIGNDKSKSLEQFLTDIENLSRLNKAGSLHYAEDTTSYVPTLLQAAPVRTAQNTPSQVAGAQESEYGNPYLLGIDLPQFHENTQQLTGQPKFNDQYEQYLYELFGGIEQPGLNTDQAIEIQKTHDGGTLKSNGYIYYPDGTIRKGSPDAYGVASLPGGRTRYSDGTVRGQQISSPMNTYAMASAGPGKYLDQFGQLRKAAGTGKRASTIEEMAQLLYGPDFQLGYFADEGATGPNGSPYASGEPRNEGIDFGMRQMGGKQVKTYLPWGGKVIGETFDDGTVWGDRSGHNGWGNSLLIQLPDGNLVRFAHLDSKNYKKGDIIDPGAYIGIVGTTGHSTGVHGSVSFGIKDENGNYHSKDANDMMMSLNNINNPVKPILGEVIPDKSKPVYDVKSDTAPMSVNRQSDNIANESKTLPNLIKDTGSTVAKYIEAKQPTGKYGIGVSEIMKGDVLGANVELANTVADIGTAIHAPELKTNELVKDQGTNVFRQALGNITDFVGSKLKIPSHNISEIIAGGDTTYTKAGMDPIIESLINTGKAGLERLKTSGPGVARNIFSSATRDLGDTQLGTKTSSPVSSATPELIDTQKQGKLLDNRDSFFKSGDSKNYAGMLKDGIGANYRGALSTDLFKDDFYNDADNVVNVFGDTSMAGEATNKFRDVLKKSFPILDNVDRYTTREEMDEEGNVYQVTKENDDWIRNEANKKYLASVPTVLTKGSQMMDRGTYEALKSLSPTQTKTIVSRAHENDSPTQTASASIQQTQPQQNDVIKLLNVKPEQLTNKAIQANTKQVVQSLKSVSPQTQQKIAQAVAKVPVQKMQTASASLVKAPPKPQSQPTQNIFKQAINKISSFFKK